MTTAKAPGSMADILGQLTARVRESLKTEYSKADQFPPAYNPARLGEAAKIKTWAETGRAACIQLSKGQVTGGKGKELLSSERDNLELVERRFARVAAAAGESLEAAKAAVAEFNGWKETTGALAWETFVELQEPIGAHAREVVAAQKKVKAYQDCSGRATAIAVALRNQHPHGPDNVVGTVIAGLVDSGSGNAWVGTSGPPKSHTVMDQLLSGVAQVEEWPVNVCGEVDAMIQYLQAAGITRVEDIPRGALFSHAETWDARAHGWKGRSACGNCGAWLDKIGANRA